MQNLNRTFAGRTAYYSPDGHGRDWYILHNHGGLIKKPCVTGLNSESSPKNRTYSPPQPKMEAKFTRYSSDGSGRDAYIHSNFGGLVSPYGSKPFYTTLRTWSPTKTVNNNNIYFQSQQVWSNQRTRKNSAQEELNSRLSAPKKVESFGLSSSESPRKERLSSKNSVRVPFPKLGAF